MSYLLLQRTDYSFLSIILVSSIFPSYWFYILAQIVLSEEVCCPNAAELNVSFCLVPCILFHRCTKKATIHQVTTMLATSKNVLFPGHKHLLTTGADDTLLACAQAIIKVSCHQYRWLAGGYDLQIGHF